jgi:PAS domain S-box-containing protein
MNIRAYKSLAPSEVRTRLYSWPAAFIGLLVIKGALSVTTTPSAGAARFGTILYFLLLVLGGVFATRKAIAQPEGSRLFWALMACGYALWALDQWLYLYYVIGLGTDVPDSSIADPALFMHVVPFMAALATQPHLNRSHRRPSRASLNFFLLLFFWVFLYAYFLFPHQYLWNSDKYGVRFDILYAIENITLVVAAAVATLRARGEWRSIYLQLFGASALYALSSTLANFVIDTGRQYNGSFYSLAQTAAVCWFVWLPLQPGLSAPAKEISNRPDAGYTDLTSQLAMLAVIAIPLIGIWEEFRPGQHPGMHSFRVAVVLVSSALLAACVFLKEHLMNRQLAADVRVGTLQQQLSEAALSDSEALKGSILSSLENLIAVLDKSGTVIDVNQAWNRGMNEIGLPSWSAGIGTNYRETLRRSADSWPDALEVLAVIETVMNGSVPRLRYDYRSDSSPQPRWFAATVTPLRTRDGGVVVCFKDITDVKKVEVRYGELVETVRAIVWRAEAPTFQVTYVNKQAEEILGYPADSWVKQQGFWQNHIHPDDREWVVALTTKAIREERRHDFECRMLAADGRCIWLRNIFNVIGGDGLASELICLSVDITERKLAEEKLKASEERSRRLVQNSSVAMVVCRGLEQKVEFLNHKFTALFGYTADDIPDVGHWWPLAYPDEAYREMIKAEWQARVVNAISNGTDIEPIEANVKCKDGSTRHIEAHLACMGDTNLVTLIDLTERKRVEVALREGEERLRLAVQAGRMYAYEWDVATDIVTRSPECVDILGEDESEQTTRMELMAQVHPDDQKRVEISCSQLTPDNPDCQVSYRLFRNDGSLIWVEKSARAVFDENGKLLRTIGVVADITARKYADETRFRHAAILESSDDAIISKNLDGTITSWNAGAQRIFGYSEAEAVGQSIAILVPSELRDDDSRLLQRLRLGETIEHYETVRVTKAGRKVNVSLTICPVRDSAGMIVGASKIVRDITERKLAEVALRESEGRFRLVANTAPVLIWMSGPDKLCNYFNQPWLDFTGRPLDAELGNGWAEGVHPEDLKACLDTYIHAFDRRQQFEMQYRLRRHDGEYRWISDTGVPRFNPDRSFAGYIGSCIDVTDHKRAEDALSTVSRRLIEAHEEERTWIARELHDDVNQRVALLAIELGVLKQNLPDSSREIRDRIQKVGKSVSEIGKDIQALSHRLHSSKLEYLGILAAMAGFCKELSEHQNVEIDFNHSNVPSMIPPEVALCLFRVLQQALHNAVRHSGVRSFRVDLRGASDEIELTVSDLGVGFDPKVAIHGKGLGLISMRERLHLVRGEISIDSKLNCGTTVHVKVPVRSTGRNGHGLRFA